MKTSLLNMQKRMDCEEYTLKEIALYFEKYNNFVCKIETDYFILQFKIEKYVLPHILGLQYAYANRKDGKQYKGKNGFEKLKNGKITLSDLKKNIRKNTSSQIAWQNVKRRIEYLPVFLNNMEHDSKLLLFEKEKYPRVSLLQGKYLLYKTFYENSKRVYPMFSIKEISQHKAILETFIVEPDISLLYGLEEINIKKIELISPIDVTLPIKS